MNVTDKRGIIEKIPGMDKVVLELGCGKTRRFPDSITIDLVDMEHVDLVLNVNDGLPFLKDSCVDAIYTYHSLEHFDDFESVMKEISRVLKLGGKLIGAVPHFSNPYFYSDYTHKILFGLYTFSYFSKQKHFKRTVPEFYNDLNFKINTISLGFHSPFRGRRYIKKAIQSIVNSCNFLQEFYEENLCYLLPAYDIKFEIEKI